MKKGNNFDWIYSFFPQTPQIQVLIRCCTQLKPRWSTELDATTRVLMYSIADGLGSRDITKYFFSSIIKLAQQRPLYVSHFVNIAAEIIENSYFIVPDEKNTFCTPTHCKLVKECSAKWLNHEKTELNNIIREVPII